VGGADAFLSRVFAIDGRNCEEEVRNDPAGRECVGLDFYCVERCRPWPA
jgi:hypothetical protein